MRNMMCFQNAFPDKPLDIIYLFFANFDIIYLCLSFLQKWKILMKLVERAKIDGMVEMVMKATKEFRPLKSNPSDIGFI
jgi:hypothetical protein